MLTPGPRSSIAALALAALAAPTAAGSADLSALLAGHGLRPVSPPTPAPDLTLPRLAGGEASLSEHLGDWVLLTFFAAWCAPCRVEMPSLETLHRERGAAGLAVVGVSIDARLDEVRPFTEQLGLSFELLWDERGEAAAAYRAHSIPLSYLIDPEGRVVAVSRGARDWSSVVPMIDSLLAAMPPAAGDGASGYAPAGPLDLPVGFEPPTAEVALAEPSPVAGESFHLDVRLRWAGDFADYLPLAPVVHLPEGVERRRMTASSSSQDGGTLVSYRLELAAGEPGSYALDPVELRYTPRFEAAPVTRRIAGPTVDVGPRALAGLTPSRLAVGAAGASLLIAALVVAWRARRAGGAAAAAAPAASYDRLKELFDEARGARLRGEAAAYLERLAALEADLGAGDAAAAAEMERLVEAARFGGRIPPAEELDRHERRIERRLQAWRDDPARGRRAALRLREEKSG